jgi:hypothetical protein
LILNVHLTSHAICYIYIKLNDLQSILNLASPDATAPRDALPGLSLSKNERALAISQARTATRARHWYLSYSSGAVRRS